MRYKVVYRCSCGEVRELMEDSKSTADREAQARWVRGHTASLPEHELTLNAMQAPPEKPLSHAE